MHTSSNAPQHIARPAHHWTIWISAVALIAAVAAVVSLAAPTPAAPAAAQDDPTPTPPPRAVEVPGFALQAEWTVDGAVTNTFSGPDGTVCLVTERTTITCYDAAGEVRGGPYQPKPLGWDFLNGWPAITNEMDMWTWTASRNDDGVVALTLATLEGEIIVDVELPTEILIGGGELWGAAAPDGTFVVGTRGGNRFGILRPAGYSTSGSSGGDPVETITLSFTVRSAAFDADGTLYAIDDTGQLYYATGDDVNRPTFGDGFVPFADPLPDDHYQFSREGRELLLVTVASGDTSGDAVTVYRIGGAGRGTEPLSLLQFEIQFGTSQIAGRGGNIIVKPDPDGLIIFTGGIGGIMRIDPASGRGPVLVYSWDEMPGEGLFFTEVSGLNAEIAVITRTPGQSQVQVYGTN